MSFKRTLTIFGVLALVGVGSVWTFKFKRRALLLLRPSTETLSGQTWFDDRVTLEPPVESENTTASIDADRVMRQFETDGTAGALDFIDQLEVEGAFEPGAHREALESLRAQVLCALNRKVAAAAVMHELPASRGLEAAVAFCAKAQHVREAMLACKEGQSDRAAAEYRLAGKRGSLSPAAICHGLSNSTGVWVQPEGVELRGP